MNEWWLIVWMAVVTFVPRYLPFALATSLKLPNSLKRSLGFVPIAVLTAIIAQTALIREGSFNLSWYNHHAVATLAAFTMAVATRHLFATITAGLTTFLLLRFFVGQ